MINRTVHRINAALERRLPEQRLFLKSDRSTRFIRLRPWTQAIVISAAVFTVAWTIVASSILVIDSIGSGNARERARQSDRKSVV